MFPLPGYQDSGRIFVDTEINDQLELLRQTQPGRGDRDYQPIRKEDKVLAVGQISLNTLKIYPKLQKYLLNSLSSLVIIKYSIVL